MKGINPRVFPGGEKPSYYDVPYGLPTPAFAATSMAMQTTAGFYQGMSIINTGTSVATISIYDHTSSASGSLVDIITVPATTSVNTYNIQTPKVFKNGLFIVSTGSGLKATIFYSPKG